MEKKDIENAVSEALIEYTFKVVFSVGIIICIVLLVAVIYDEGKLDGSKSGYAKCQEIYSKKQVTFNGVTF